MQTPRLDDFLNRFGGRISVVRDWKRQRENISTSSELIALYDELYHPLEALMWQGEQFEDDLKIYQSLFREQEELIAQAGNDERHEFILSIPIADRPEHLQSCLESIYQLCLLYGYGGMKNGVYQKVRVIVAEDSQAQENIDADIRIAESFCARGLSVEHVGLAEQFEMLQSIPPSQRELLGSILTTQPRDHFFRKGQAANRNLSYLKMLQLTEVPDKTLYYLVDSDQLFQVNRQAGAEDMAVPALNYFYYIDHIFRDSNTTMLTGKLVGDPPVSPSVMAVNFIDDVIHFLKKMAQLDPHQACSFHDASQVPDGEAVYHDMAKMFGFSSRYKHYEYRCPLQGKHDNAQCLEYFSTRLNAFFYGEHLTRKTRFSYEGSFTQLTPARTIYPGNYIVNYGGLKYIIPFGDLRLRMSGPTAGRLVQAEIGQRFASVNLPMLHQRTQSKELADDFRPGVEKGAERIELSDEFERQFFGDLMLFTVAELAPRSAGGKNFKTEDIIDVLDSKERELLKAYQTKHDDVIEKGTELKAWLRDDNCWWRHATEMEGVLKHFEQFVENVDFNFGGNSAAWQQIQSGQHREKRKQQIISALKNYRLERDAWDSLFRDS